MVFLSTRTSIIIYLCFFPGIWRVEKTLSSLANVVLFTPSTLWSAKQGPCPANLMKSASTSGGFQKWGIPKWMVYIGKPHWSGWYRGYPPGNPHTHKHRGPLQCLHSHRPSHRMRNGPSRSEGHGSIEKVDQAWANVNPHCSCGSPAKSSKRITQRKVWRYRQEILFNQLRWEEAGEIPFLNSPVMLRYLEASQIGGNPKSSKSLNYSWIFLDWNLWWLVDSCLLFFVSSCFSIWPI